MLRIKPDIQTPKAQGHCCGQGHLKHIIRTQIEQSRRQSDQQAREQRQASTLQTLAPARKRHQQQPMPEAETPGGLSRVITAERHHAAVHQRSQGGNLGGEIQQRLPSLPAPTGKETKRTAMVEGAVEIVGLIPGWNSALVNPPEAIQDCGQQPDQNNPKAEAPPLSHAISSRRRSS